MVYICDNTTIKSRCGNKQYCLHIQREDIAESPREWENTTIMACFHRRYSLGDAKLAAEPAKFWRDLVSQNVTNEEMVQTIMAGQISGVRIANRPDGLVDIYETADSVADGTKEYLEYEGIHAVDVREYVLDDLTIGNCMELMKPHAEWLPLWLYDHTGLTISCGTRTYPYNDRFDSGQVGWIVALKDNIMKGTTGVKGRPLTEETWRKRALEAMQMDVKVYDMYLQGNVFSYTLYSAEVPGANEDGEEPDPDEAPDWEEEDSCGGFYGDDLLENGILDNLPKEFVNAIRDNDYEEGEAVLRTVQYFDF